MPAREFVDSNIWLHALVLAGDAGADQKHHRASDLLTRVDRPVINSQIVREVCSNLLKKAKLGEADVQRVIQDWYLTCELHPSNEQQHLLASRLRETASFSFWVQPDRGRCTGCRLFDPVQRRHAARPDRRRAPHDRQSTAGLSISWGRS